MKIYGHRGARNECPENTLASFEHAYKNDTRYFELDIQLSKDKELVVIHDTTTDRTTGHHAKVRDLTLEELCALDARKGTPPWPTPTPIPSLAEVVDHCPEVEHWQFEVKPDAAEDMPITAQKLLDFIEARELSDKATITSSSKAFLEQVNQLNPKQSKGLVFEKSLRNPVTQAKHVHCDFLILHWILCNESIVKEANQLGMNVSCWTVNRIADMEKLQAMKVHSVITDLPTSALIHFNRI